MLEKLRTKVAEYLHPEKDNPDYWLLKSLEKKDITIELGKYKEYKNPKKVKADAVQLKQSQLLKYMLQQIEHEEVNNIARKISDVREFFYSRSIIHVVHTLRDKINKIANFDIGDKKEFNKFDVI